uniref:Protein Y45F10D.1 putative n=1 Tax=Albugo laibachii Nc14 TaxID=890382 RepID=F0W9N0_9STRA|nr:protein Y45F10D.1 putative [Albugo laibachii Nc14]|eukprot:CCA17848.1 protein Y45F10D.1 putative [Albugo laibachii Nc14]
MGKAAELTTAEKKIILRFWKTNMSYRKIAAVVGRGKCTVERVAKVSETPVPPSKCSDSVKIDSSTRRLIIRKVSSGAGCAKNVRDALQLLVSVSKVQRCLEKMPWLKYKKLRHGPILKPRQVRDRLNWTDEKKWNMEGPDGYKQWIDTRAKQSVPNRRHSGGVLFMIWGGFCGDRKTTLDFLDGRVTSIKYMATLQNHLQPAFDIGTQIYQHDNVAPHAAPHEDVA